MLQLECLIGNHTSNQRKVIKPAGRMPGRNTLPNRILLLPLSGSAVHCASRVPLLPPKQQHLPSCLIAVNQPPASLEIRTLSLHSCPRAPEQSGCPGNICKPSAGRSDVRSTPCLYWPGFCSASLDVQHLKLRTAFPVLTSRDIQASRKFAG